MSTAINFEKLRPCKATVYADDLCKALIVDHASQLGQRLSVAADIENKWNAREAGKPLRHLDNIKYALAALDAADKKNAKRRLLLGGNFADPSSRNCARYSKYGSLPAARRCTWFPHSGEQPIAPDARYRKNHAFNVRIMDATRPFGS